MGKAGLNGEKGKGVQAFPEASGKVSPSRPTTKGPA